jgi:hypothetical protein
MLEDAAKAANTGEQIKVLDIAELVSLGISEAKDPRR